MRERERQITRQIDRMRERNERIEKQLTTQTDAGSEIVKTDSEIERQMARHTET